MRVVKQNTILFISALMVSAEDHVTGLEGLSSINAKTSKSGAAFQSTTIDLTEIGNGWYYISFPQSETDTQGDLIINLTADGADPTDILMLVSTASTEEVCSMVRDIYILKGLSDIESEANKLTGKWIAGDIELDMTGDGVNTQKIRRH